MKIAIAILLVILNLAILAAAVWIAFKIIRRMPRIGPKGTLVTSPDGRTVVPVYATFTGVRGVWRWLCVASNSLNPHLRITAEGIEYRVTFARTVRFEDIRSVEIMTGPLTVNLMFTFNTGPWTLAANVGDEALAQQVLDRLPARLRSQA